MTAKALKKNNMERKSKGTMAYKMKGHTLPGVNQRIDKSPKSSAFQKKPTAAELRDAANNPRNPNHPSKFKTRAEYEADLSNTGAPNPTNLSGNPTLPIRPLSPIAQNQVTPTILPMSAPQQTPESIAASDTSRRPLRGRVRGFFNNLFYRVQE